MTLDTYFHEFNLFAKSLYPSMHIFKIFGERYVKATSIQFHFFIFLWKECLESAAGYLYPTPVSIIYGNRRPVGSQCPTSPFPRKDVRRTKLF